MTTSAGIPPGRTCRDSGGIFDPGKACQTSAPRQLDFSTMSAHYVSPLVINREGGIVEKVPPTDIRARTYRGSVPVDAAIEWIKRQPDGTAVDGDREFRLGAHADDAAAARPAGVRRGGHQRPRLLRR